MEKRTLLITSRLFFAMIATVAMAVQFVIHVRNGSNVVNYFSYFTNLSNIIAAGTLFYGAVHLIKRRKPSVALDALRGAAFVYMTIVGVVFSVLLRNAELGALLPWVNQVLHYTMPVYVFLEFFYQPPSGKLSKAVIPYWLIFPLAYLAYSLIRGPFAHFYPYPFLSPGHDGGYLRVALYSIAICVIFVLASLLAVRLANARRGSARA